MIADAGGISLCHFLATAWLGCSANARWCGWLTTLFSLHEPKCRVVSNRIAARVKKNGIWICLSNVNKKIYKRRRHVYQAARYLYEATGHELCSNGPLGAKHQTALELEHNVKN
jgi:hypothetical protein